jgi:KUP system potassium uptake protein
MAEQHSSPERAFVPDVPYEDGATKEPFWKLTLGSVGVVYGDIGTSPLYAFRESVKAAAGAGPVTPDVIIGVLSLMLWSLTLIVTVKYIVILLRADNNGEGGTLTLVALAQRAIGRRGYLILLLGAAGAGLFYGDAIITPAISVLSAVEGLTVATRAFDPYVVPATVAILLLLFSVQSKGTAAVAAFFGPVMVIWFIILIGTGLLHITDHPQVFAAINPAHGVSFLVGHPGVAMAVLGGVALVATGTESLYADLGHFGRGPIRAAWLGLVLRPFRTRSTNWCRTGQSFRWQGWRRSPPSPPVRR